ncbi:hypothetical protein F5Y09DRAFT_54640 [Xylaria sp. FL1042]|nr:hypothetical protein F5Y09DRAFT_54640 [Xylaria sp. FL1042]
MDSVEKLFQDLPSPDAERAFLDKQGEWDVLCFQRVFQSFSPSTSNDPDREAVARWVQILERSSSFATLRSEIGQFALDMPIIPDDGSAKSLQLKYHAWISQGRKDHDYPFEQKDCSSGQQDDLLKDSDGFLPAKLTDPKICANCAKPNAKTWCGGCLLVQDSHVILKTPYCNKDCQTQHWKEHKPYCLAKKKIIRAVSLIYDLFIMFEKKAWFSKQVVGITERQGTTNIIHSEPCEWEVQGKPFVRHFPSVQAPSEQHFLAALLDSECQQLLTTFDGLVDLLLLPACKDLSEVQMVPRNAYRPTCDMRRGGVHNTMYNHHTVLCITLKSDEKVVVDIGGAQFGWREVIAPWDIWTNQRVAGTPVHQDYGYAKECLNMDHGFVVAQYIQASDAQRLSLAQKMELAVETKMTELNLSSALNLYKLDNDDFASCKQAILSCAEEALDNGLRKLHESKLGRCYINSNGHWQATTTKEQAEALKRVWLSEEDVRKAKERGRNLMMMYRLRCRNPVTRQKLLAAGLSIY